MLRGEKGSIVIEYSRPTVGHETTVGICKREGLGKIAGSGMLKKSPTTFLTVAKIFGLIAGCSDSGVCGQLGLIAGWPGSGVSGQLGLTAGWPGSGFCGMVGLTAGWPGSGLSGQLGLTAGWPGSGVCGDRQKSVLDCSNGGADGVSTPFRTKEYDLLEDLPFRNR